MRYRSPLLVTFGSILEPDGGLAVRSRTLAESTFRLGAAAAIVSTREPVADARPPWARSLVVPARHPKKGFSLELARLIRREARDCDVVVIANAMFMPALTVSGCRLPMVWDTNECQSLHYSRLPTTPPNLAKRAIWWVLESWAARRCSLAVAIGSAEAAQWARLWPSLSARLVTVDHAPFVRADQVRRAASGSLLRRLGRPGEGPLLVFVGTMTAKHNAVAARWIIEVLTPTLPASSTVVLCGGGSDRLAPADPRVLCLGNIPDVDAVVSSADLCVAPLAAGAGVKTKVLHYLAHGRRVAGTPVAFEGLDSAPGLYQASLADLPQLVGRLLAERPSELSDQARSVAQKEWLASKHGLDRVAEQWSRVFECATPP